MKTVAISQRVDSYPDRNEQRDALDQQLCLWISEAGFLPVPVPNLLSTVSDQKLHLWLQAMKPEAVLLSGGNDIGHVQKRDATEASLLSYAKDQKLPVLGICRGMQMMAVWAGVELKPVAGHIGTRHQLIGEINDEVNSYHNYVLAECPSGYSVLARSEDEHIEAIRHDSLGWEGWMWHPERGGEFHPHDVQRLKTLFNE